ncbi:hypothetical protein DPMN_112332 [Dreissena polymorpha]|uniref:Uncharacterized protein n=1 Tax=Dreissena polymorpha TaxID=45954 RepID=A0A9D4KG44_DREPO|nr:hypothetical protein DPMN_112332 [Dreissena polymorpha]
MFHLVHIRKTTKTLYHAIGPILFANAESGCKVVSYSNGLLSSVYVYYVSYGANCRGNRPKNSCRCNCLVERKSRERQERDLPFSKQHLPCTKNDAFQPMKSTKYTADATADGDSWIGEANDTKQFARGRGFEYHVG